MSNTSFIITKSKNLKIPKETPHFIISDDIYFPIYDPNCVKFNDFISLVINNKKYDIKDYYTNKFDFVELTKKLNINSFVAYHYSEFGMMPLYICKFSVVKNIVIKESILCPDERIIAPENYSEFENELEKNSPEILLNIEIDEYLIERLNDFEYTKFLYEKWGNSIDFLIIDKINSEKNKENQKKLDKENQKPKEVLNKNIQKIDNGVESEVDDMSTNSFFGILKRIFKL